MEYGQALIDKAAQKGYTRYRLSVDLHVNQSHLAKLAKGDKPISPVLAAKIAEAIGEDARVAALTAVVEHAEQTERAALMRSLGIGDWRKRSLSIRRHIPFRRFACERRRVPSRV